MIDLDVVHLENSEIPMAKRTANWLKKYTKLRHLQPMLENRQLHLGAPEGWDDKNDSELIQLYSKASGGFVVRVNCLTMAQDRFHFWDVFGERENGVCLWFDKVGLLADIQKDQSLVANNVQYKLPSELCKLEPKYVPFAKRKQYQDEDEFRVLRVKPAEHMALDKFEFSASSLRKIYLNPWLKNSEVVFQKGYIGNMLGNELGHVEILQNRTLRKQDWIDAAKQALKTDT